MKIATAEYTHSALVLVTPQAAGDGVTVKVGAKAVDTGIKLAQNGPKEGAAEALYAANTTAKDALLISDIKKDTVLHIFSGTLDQNTAGAGAKTFTIPVKEIPQTEAEKLKDKTTFAELTKTSLATDFKWIGK